MKKLMSILLAMIIGISSVSIINSGLVSTGTEASLCFPPSTCQQCTHDFCACRNIPGFCWCHNYCSEACNGQIGEGCYVLNNGYEPVVPGSLNQECQACLDNCCEVESFQYCQQEWFHPYWMEIYNDNVKGCYARDLLCFNNLVENHACPESCYDYEKQEFDKECCESSYCYLYREPTLTQFSLDGQSITINVPSCTNPRTFFKNPPPCGYLNDDFLKTEQIQINGYNRLSCCYDMRNCTTSTLECSTPCSGYDLPPNYSCNMNEVVILGIDLIGGEILINGVPYQFSECPTLDNGCEHMVVWYTGQKPFSAVPGIVYVNQGVPRTITISGTGSITFYAEQKCCYDCKQKPSLPSSILYPKVDIETLSIAGGPTVIKDGKILSSLTISPGIQQAMIQVENRGFFTQNDSRVRFEGLPAGVTVSVQPDAQKITAHNIGTYSAIFTVGPNVLSGTYKVTMIAYSPNGVFDTITIDFVVP